MDPALRDAYTAAATRSIRRGATAYCAFASLFMLATIPLDRVRFPQLAGALVPIRVAGVLGLGVVLLLLRTAVGERRVRLLATLVPCVAATMVLALAVRTGGPGSPVNLSMNFILVGVALVMPWSARWSALACALVLGGYVGTMAAFEGARSRAFMDDVFVLTAVSTLTVFMTGTRERARRREFAQGWALERAHSEARASGERYRSLVETAGGAIIALSPAGAITEFNREAERLLGWRREEAIGRDYASLCIAAEDREAAVADLHRALAFGPSRDRELRLRTRDGSARVVLCNASRLVDDGGTSGIIVCAHDITDRKRTEEALRESEARLRTVIADAPIILFAVDPTGVVTLSEGKGLARVGLAPGELVGRPLVEHTPHIGPLLTRALAGEAVNWTGTAGEARFECRCAPTRDASGRVTGAIGLALDVTERTQAEEVRLALERKLLETQKLESLGVLAGGIAHDFNNLLVSVLGNASLVLADLPPGAATRPKLELIETAARRGADLTRQMLAYAGRGAVALERVRVNDLLAEMQSLLAVSISKTVTAQYEPAPHLPAIEADPTQIRQVLMNLFVNASEAIGDAVGTVHVRTSVVDLDVAALQAARSSPGATPGAHVCIEVTDTGCGMDAATIEKIFDPFFSTKFAGRGLGLATVIGIVRRHRGALAVTTTPGRGTTFRIFLPTAPGDSPAAAAAPPATPEAEPRGRTVLVVEDEDDVRAVTQHMLERLGCRVLAARDGPEGVEVFRAHAHVIDAAIVDLTLPRVGGEQVARQIHAIRPDTRVILMSGYDNEHGTDDPTARGAADFLRKPFTVGDLRTTIDRALRPPGGDPDGGAEPR